MARWKNQLGNTMRITFARLGQEARERLPAAFTRWSLNTSSLVKSANFLCTPDVANIIAELPPQLVAMLSLWSCSFCRTSWKVARNDAGVWDFRTVHNVMIYNDKKHTYIYIDNIYIYYIFKVTVIALFENSFADRGLCVSSRSALHIIKEIILKCKSTCRINSLYYIQYSYGILTILHHISGELRKRKTETIIPWSSNTFV